jgi:hypothetical protein
MAYGAFGQFLDLKRLFSKQILLRWTAIGKPEQASGRWFQQGFNELSIHRSNQKLCSLFSSKGLAKEF